MAKADLSAIQREAVQCIDQPVLIFAGAGSGKTKVLTHKIAYLRNEVGIPDDNILAVTFTNKAAREMSQRVVKLIDATASDSRYKAGPIWSPMLHSNGAVQVGTFHSICARILRKEIHHLGYKNDFVIYDADDQLRLLKMVLEQNEYDLDLHPPQHYRSVISRAKNGMKGPVDLATKAKGEEADIFTKYQEALKNSHAVDFDDLLLLPLDLFNNHPKILNRYRKTFQYILVDEYQDTNRAQFEFVKLLAQKHRHICVVGDDDQSIYSWRGADITNILNFEKEFPDAEVFKLEQNYRSTAIILDAAHAVVERNQNRADKKLWTERKGGEAIQIYALENEREEAEQIFNLIQEEVLSNKRRFGDIVILYRTNAQSRAIEDILRRRTIAYKIIGGIKFYERKEVKDAMAYLRLLVNPSDPVSLERIINFPPRAIGETSMNRLRTFAHERKIDLFKSLGSGLEAGIQVKQAGAMKDFKAMIKRYQGLALNKDRGSPAGPVDEYSGMESSSSSHNFGVDEVVTAFLEEAGLIAHFRNQETTEAHDRLENIKELINSIEEFHIENPGSTIRDFLEDVALLSDVDRWADDTNAVTLMTLHSAKGLEFPVVFLTGLEEGLFPLIRMNDDENDEEEERRLFYVGLTRTQDKAYITYAKQRRKWGSNTLETVMSRFIRELPDNLVEWKPLTSKEASKNGSRISSGDSRVYPKVGHPAPVVQGILDDFVIGAWVEHKLFGKGRIMGREGVADSLKLTVEFEGNKTKKLVAKYANLHRL